MDTVLSALSAGLAGSLALALLAAFAWGIASLVLSPCHLAGIPLLVAFINGQPVVTPRRAAALAAVFGVGIFGAIVVVGVATAGLGRLAGDLGPWVTYVVAAVFFLAGLSLLDVIPANWTPPQVASLRGRGAFGALALGLVFGVALGPCTFAYLAPVLGVAFAAGTADLGFAGALVIAFALGHCLLLVLAGASAGRFRSRLSAAGGARLQAWRYASGVLVLIGGVYLVYVA